MTDPLDIVVTGFDVDPHEAELGLCRVFGMAPSEARDFVRSLPRVAKRDASGAVLTRYLEALRSIGARVQARPPQTGNAPLEMGPSLPAPASSRMADVHQSLRVDYETERVVARFVAEESEFLIERESVPDAAPDHIVSIGPDPMNPRIPRAPRLPRVGGMPNDDRKRAAGAAGARPSRRPRDSFGNSLQPDLSLSDLAADSARVPLHDQPKATGTTRHSTRPSLRSARALDLLRQKREHERKARGSRRKLLFRLLLVLMAFTGLTLGYRYMLGARDRDLRRAALADAGIDPGRSADMREFLRDETHRVHGIERAKLEDLVERFERAGARSLSAVRIEGSQADALVVELPADAAQRRTLLFQLARLRRREPSLQDDHGQRYEELRFGR